MNAPNQTPTGPATAAGDTPLATRREAAALLKVSIETLKRWEKSRYLTAIRCGPKLVRYKLAEIQTLAGGRA